MGPVAFDLGNLSAMHVLALAALGPPPGGAADAADAAAQRQWLLGSFAELWEAYVESYERECVAWAARQPKEEGGEPGSAAGAPGEHPLPPRLLTSYGDVVLFTVFCTWRLAAGEFGYPGFARVAQLHGAAEEERCRTRAVRAAHGLLRLWATTGQEDGGDGAPRGGTLELRHTLEVLREHLT